MFAFNSEEDNQKTLVSHPRTGKCQGMMKKCCLLFIVPEITTELTTHFCCWLAVQKEKSSSTTLPEKPIFHLYKEWENTAKQQTCSGTAAQQPLI